MPRLFIALDIPESIKQSIVQLQIPIPSARWVKPDTMHLTLRFIGDVDSERVAPLKNALAKISAPAFTMRLKATGRFPSNPKKAPRVLWLGVDAPPVLHYLQRQIESAITALNLPHDNKPFKPHITLARLKTHNPLPEVNHFLTQNTYFMTNTFHITEFLLVSSILSSQGSTYTHEASFALTDN